MDTSEAHARLYAAMTGIPVFNLEEETRKTATRARERELHERRPEPVPQDAHQLLLEAFGGPPPAPQDAHRTLMDALTR